MIRFGERRRDGAPVILGNDVPTVEMPRCDACGTVGDAEPVRLEGADAEQVAAYLCRDGAACARRYRGGVTAREFALALRAATIEHRPAVMA